MQKKKNYFNVVSKIQTHLNSLQKLTIFSFRISTKLSIMNMFILITEQ